MQLAQSTEDWLSQNALFCNRYHARLNQLHCEENRQSNDVARCSGCGGLEDQEREIARQEPVVFFSDGPDDHDPEPLKEALADALQEALDEFLLDDLEEPEEETAGEPAGFQSQLLALLGDDFEEELIERRSAKKERRRFAVFMGRCPRCWGYMVNAPERYGDIRDDDVYRCFNCSYRTSPGYQQSRELGA